MPSANPIKSILTVRNQLIVTVPDIVEQIGRILWEFRNLLRCGTRHNGLILFDAQSGMRLCKRRWRLNHAISLSSGLLIHHLKRAADSLVEVKQFVFKFGMCFQKFAEPDLQTHQEQCVA